MQHHFMRKKAKPSLRFGLLLLGLSLGALTPTYGQQDQVVGGPPITISLFTHSVSLPNFRGLFTEPNWGLRIGTEWSYGRKMGSRWIQTFHLGYYHHQGFQQGVFVGSDFGYRLQLGRLATDLSIGANYLHLITVLERYEPAGEGYQPASKHLHKLMPALGWNLAYRTGSLAEIFLRYETFGEIPFNYQGVPVLPHQALHLGTRIHPF